MRSTIKKLIRIYYLRERGKHREMEGGVEGQILGCLMCVISRNGLIVARSLM